MASALYNRYRPRSFAEVVGQEHVTAALAQALRAGRIHHAYLFSGPRGCGKTSSARILAASLNCLAGPTAEPCGRCEQCVAIRAGSSVDVTEIDAASHGLVEDTRDLRDRAGFSPVSARYRVFIIDEAHMISTAGFNALLKIVEEPPPHVLFVFATTDPDKVLPTIRSRTFQYHFRLVPPAVLAAHLARVCEAEGAAVDPAVLPLVVRAGAGSVRDALSVLDQILAGGATSVADARALLGATDSVLLDDAVAALAERDAPALFGLIDRTVGAGHDPRRFAADLLERLRDLILLSAVPDAVDRGLLAQEPPDQLTRMAQQARRLGPAELSWAADLVHRTLVDMRGTTSPRLLLELLAARLLLPSASQGAASWLTRLERLERRLDLAGPAATPPAADPAAANPAGADPGAGPAPGGGPARATTPARGSEPAAGEPAAGSPAGQQASRAGLDVAALGQVWPQVLEAVKSRRRTAHVLLAQHAVPVALAPSPAPARGGTDLTLAFTRPAFARNFTAGGHVEVLAEALAEVLGGGWRVLVSDQAAPAGPGAPAPDGGADLDDADLPALGDPVALVKQAFGATVIGEIDLGRGS